MKTCHPKPPLSCDTPTVRIGPGYWNLVPGSQRDDLIRHHVQRALRLAKDRHLPLPAGQKRFELIVLLAVEAELMFFNAALWEPSSADREMFFADFLERALTASQDESPKPSGTSLQIE